MFGWFQGASGVSEGASKAFWGFRVVQVLWFFWGGLMMRRRVVMTKGTVILTLLEPKNANSFRIYSILVSLSDLINLNFGRLISDKASQIPIEESSRICL